MFLGPRLVTVVQASTFRTENIAYASGGAGAATLDPRMRTYGRVDFPSLPRAAANASVEHPGPSVAAALGS